MANYTNYTNIFLESQQVRFFQSDPNTFLVFGLKDQNTSKYLDPMGVYLFQRGSKYFEIFGLWGTIPSVTVKILMYWRGITVILIAAPLDNNVEPIHIFLNI